MPFALYVVMKQMFSFRLVSYGAVQLTLHLMLGVSVECRVDYIFLLTAFFVLVDDAGNMVTTRGHPVHDRKCV